jgi:hypothetical protein
LGTLLGGCCESAALERGTEQAEAGHEERCEGDTAEPQAQSHASGDPTDRVGELSHPVLGRIGVDEAGISEPTPKSVMIGRINQGTQLLCPPGEQGSKDSTYRGAVIVAGEGCHRHVGVTGAEPRP